MKNFINELNEKIKLHIGDNKYADETLFNYGVELGKHLTKTNAQDIRLDFFVKQSETINKKDIIWKHKQNIEKYLLSIIRMAVKMQVSDGSSLTFSNEQYYRGDGKFSKEVEEKYNLEYVRVEQSNTGGDFEIIYKVTNELKDIFDKFEIYSEISFDLENSTGETHETIYDEDDANDIYGAFIHIYPNKLDVDKITEFENEISKFLTKLVMFG